MTSTMQPRAAATEAVQPPDLAPNATGAVAPMDEEGTTDRAGIATGGAGTMHHFQGLPSQGPTAPASRPRPGPRPSQRRGPGSNSGSDDSRPDAAAAVTTQANPVLGPAQPYLATGEMPSRPQRVATMGGAITLGIRRRSHPDTPIPLAADLPQAPKRSRQQFTVYAVACGREGPRVYTDWATTHLHTNGFGGAAMKGFTTFAEAFTFIAQACKLEEYKDYLDAANPDALAPGLLDAWQTFCCSRQQEHPAAVDSSPDARE